MEVTLLQSDAMLARRSFGEDIGPIPFATDVLDEACRSGMFLFGVPAGSFGSFYEDSQESPYWYPEEPWWQSKDTSRYILTSPKAMSFKCGCPYEEYTYFHSGTDLTVLTPYELAYIACIWRRETGENFVLGSVRTSAVSNLGTPSHLNAGSLRIVLSWKPCGTLVVTKQYDRYASPSLGVATGYRRRV